MISIASQMQPKDYERLRSMLRTAFPDASTAARVTDTMVDSFVQSLWSKWDPRFQTELGVPPPPAGVAPAAAPASAVSTSVLGYYLAHSTHTRHRKGAEWDSFVGELPTVRVRLAQSDRSPIQTPLGVVDDDGALYFTVDEWNERLANEHGFIPAERVEVVTPPRMNGERFAAVAVYLAYTKATDAVPSQYLLEAGLAQGGPRVPYFAPTMDHVILAQTSFKPTPMSDTWHWYKGSITTNAGELLTLSVDVSLAANIPPYMQARVQFEKRPIADMPTTNPGWIRAQAALRLTALMQSLGMSTGNAVLDLILPLLADTARAHLPWIKTPPPAPPAK